MDQNESDADKLLRRLDEQQIQIDGIQRLYPNVFFLLHLLTKSNDWILISETKLHIEIYFAGHTKAVSAVKFSARQFMRQIDFVMRKKFQLIPLHVAFILIQ